MEVHPAMNEAVNDVRGTEPTEGEVLKQTRYLWLKTRGS